MHPAGRPGSAGFGRDSRSTCALGSAAGPVLGLGLRARAHSRKRGGFAGSAAAARVDRVTGAAGQRERPRRLGRYEVLFPIASGGMAEVFAARLRGEGGFEKLVALKRMLPNLARNDAFVRMFLDEGRLAAHIASPHVVATLDLGRSDEGDLFIVMELVLGVTLAAMARAREGHGVPPRIAAELIAQAATGLHHAHEATNADGTPLLIVHRDVSPQNILVGADGRVRISDFGVAHALERLGTTNDGRFKGKYSYFSPEQARGEPLDRRSDIFALGVVAWELLTGQRLFTSGSPLELLDQLVSMPIPLVDSIAPGVPHDVAVAVALALERERDGRFQSSAAMATALREAIGPPPPRADEIATFVKDAGGERLAELRQRLRTQKPPVEETAEEPETAEPRSTVTRRVRSAEAGHPLERAVAATSDADEASPPDAAAPVEPPAPDEASVSLPVRPRTGSIAFAAVLVVAIAVLAVRALTTSGASATPPVATASAEPAATAPEPTAASTAVPAPPTDEARAEPPPSASAGARVAPPPRTPPRDDRRKTATAPARSSVPASSASAPRSSPVLGVDAFDRNAAPR